MEDLVSIPRPALEKLLKDAGSPLTPEAYLASLQESSLYAKYRSRTRTALWSRNTLVVVLVLAVLSLFTGLDVEGVIIVVALAIITTYEFKVYRYFRDPDDRAPMLGFYNQIGFATCILCYGLYHAIFPHTLLLPGEFQGMLDVNSIQSIATLQRYFYLAVGFIGGGSQLWLAWYYRKAEIKD